MYYDHSYTISGQTFIIRVDPHTSLVNDGNGKFSFRNTITLTPYDGSTVAPWTDKRDEEVDAFTTFLFNDQANQISGAPNPELEAELLAKGYTKH